MSDRTPPTLGTASSHLSLAVRPMDSFTGRSAIDGPDVTLEDRPDEPVRNPSGYFVFLDIEPGSVTVLVNGGSRFLDERIPGVTAVDITDPATTVDPADPTTFPVETVELTPSPAYPFPSGTTLIRGRVLDPSDEPIPGATVGIRNHDAGTRTDRNGEYVVFIDPVPAADVTTVDDRRVFEVNDSAPELEVNDPNAGTKTVTLDDGGDSIVEVGTLTVHDITLP